MTTFWKKINKMEQLLKVLTLASSLLITRVGYSQSIKIGVEGFQRSASFSNDVTNSGPLIVNTQDKRFAYGINVSYESGKNGAEIALHSFPYRVDLSYRNFFGEQTGPNNIALISLLYKRRIISYSRRHIYVYALGGFGIGKYQNSVIKEGIGTVSVNGSVIYESHLNRFSDYDRPMILLPTLKVELDKFVFAHFIVSAHASYIFSNWFGYSKPLEKADYVYRYYQKTGSGRLSDYGNGYLVGISLKYKFDVHKKSNATNEDQ